MQETSETWVRSQAWEDPLEEEMATHSSIFAWSNPMGRGASWATVHGVTNSRTWLKWLSTHACPQRMQPRITQALFLYIPYLPPQHAFESSHLWWLLNGTVWVCGWVFSVLMWGLPEECQVLARHLSPAPWCLAYLAFHTSLPGELKLRGCSSQGRTRPLTLPQSFWASSKMGIIIPPSLCIRWRTKAWGANVALPIPLSIVYGCFLGQSCVAVMETIWPIKLPCSFQEKFANPVCETWMHSECYINMSS